MCTNLRQMKFVWWCVTSAGPQCGMCFMSLFWSLEFWSGTCIFKKLVEPCFLFHFNHRNPHCMKKWKTCNPASLGFRLSISNKKINLLFSTYFNPLLPELNSNWNLQTPGFKLHSFVFYTNCYTKNSKSKIKKSQEGCTILDIKWLMQILHQYGNKTNTLQHSTSLSAPKG